MLSMSLEQISGAISASKVIAGENVFFNSIAIDSRKAKEGDLFFALVGDKANGHQFINKALEAGAKGVVVSEEIREDISAGVAVFFVKDTLIALQSLAAYNRSLSGAMLIAVTGSSGKTSTKDLIYSVLSGKFRTLKTQGNFNNELGLPLTLLGLDEGHQVAVVEMGMRGNKEIDFLANIALPNGAVITNIGQAHIELLGSVDNIAKAKGELLEHIPEQGFGILYGDSPFIEREANRCKGKVILYGEKPEYDLYLGEVIPEKLGYRFSVDFEDSTEEFYLPLPGKHNVINSLAAIGVGHELGMSYQEIRDSLSRAKLSGMRMEVIEADGIKIINDAYNANPDSTRAAIYSLLDMEGIRKIAVLGDMLELGDISIAAHKELGTEVNSSEVDILVAVGEMGRYIGMGAQGAGFPSEDIYYFKTALEAGEGLKEIFTGGDVILVKGSRGMKMEGFIGIITN
ncbi:MAG: UDP-N-acetylmuramoyl-tripeptide--D-alanyl-D-alanine ligase [Peptococcaceae bacterium]|nr:UDP-N-acetylmuramoyl-tripeptide--D-alanyl-D-alanine ligase [Peptococcaceae bacterium]